MTPVEPVKMENSSTPDQQQPLMRMTLISVSIFAEPSSSAAKACTRFEDAMTLTGFGKFNVLTLLFCGFMLLGMILETLGFSYVIPAGQCDLELTHMEKGWLAAIPFACIILTSHTWGYLADTRGRKRILTFTMAAGSFFSVLSSFAPDLVTFAGLRFLAGIFIAAPSALGYAYLGELSPAKYRDAMIILGNASVTLGTGVVPLVAWAILPANINLDIGFLAYGYRSWRLLIVLFAMPYIICAILFPLFPKSPRFLHSQGRNEEALVVLRKIYSMNTGKDPMTYPVHELSTDDHLHNNKKSILKDVWDQTVPLFDRAHVKWTLLTCFLQFVVFSVTNGFYIWYPAVINEVLNSQEAGNDKQNMCEMLSHIETANDTLDSSEGVCDDTLHSGTFLMTTILALAVCLASIVAASLTRLLGKRALLAMVFLVAGVSGAAVHWITDMYASIVLFSMFQFCGTCIGIINAFVIDLFPTHVRAMAICVTLTVGRMGSIFGTNLIGYLIKANCPMSFFFFSGLLLVAVLATFLLPSKVKELED